MFILMSMSAYSSLSCLPLATTSPIQQKIEWAAGNGVAFDHGKTEATLFHRKRITPIATIKIGANTVPFSKEEAWWLGMWLDSQLTLKDHCATRLREGKKAMARLRRLT